MHRSIFTPFVGFGKNQSGAVAVLFGLMLLPIFGMMALALDYSLLQREQKIQQSSADAAALIAASRSSEGGRTDGQLITLAKATFAENYEKLGGKPGAPSANVTILDGVVSVSFNRPIDTAILGVFGYDELTSGVVSKAHTEEPVKLEIALVLDYSSSMDSSGKYEAMRDAAIELIESLTTNVVNPGHKFALVPFAEHVYASMSSDFIVGQPAGNVWSNCTKDRMWPHNRAVSSPVFGDDTTKWTSSAAEDNGGAGADPCNNYTFNNLSVLPLSDDENLAITQLQGMTPYQGTNIAIGVEMGWHVLSPNLPYAEGVANGTIDTQKVLVLLTDGRQNQQAHGPGGSYSEAEADAKLLELCDNIKADGIKVISIGFDLSSQEAIDPLTHCASTPDDFYDADSNSDVAQSFEAIRKALAGHVRLIQ